MAGPAQGAFQHSPVEIRVEIQCHKTLINPAVWIRFTRSDGVVATSWFSHEPVRHEIGDLSPGRHYVVVAIDDLMLGDGTYSLTVGLFPYKLGADTAFYADPICMWDRVLELSVKRRTRPLGTVFDQPMRIALEP